MPIITKISAMLAKFLIQAIIGGALGYIYVRLANRFFSRI
jgi:hypothetical protein